jgi:hypothetical protein
MTPRTKPGDYHLIRKTMKRLFGMLLCFPLCASASAGTVNGRFLTLTNDGTTYSVKVQLNANVQTGLGGATLQFTFSDANLMFPADTLHQPVAETDYSFIAFSGGAYDTATVTKPSSNKLSINIAYNGAQGAGTPVTAGVPTSSGPWTDVVVINFRTLNSQGSANLTWVDLEIVADDQLTFETNGSFANKSESPLPVQLSTFTGVVVGHQGRVKLDWGTASEVNNYGFFVQRKGPGETAFSEVHNNFVPGHATTIVPHSYSFVDSSLTKSGTYSYRLRQVDLDGMQDYSPVVIVDVSVLAVKELAPMEFKLHQNYPNPFNPETEIRFSVETTGKATLRVFNILGQEVAILFDGIAQAGQFYRVRLNGLNLASGAYFYRLENGKKNDLKRMLLLK